MQAEQQFKRIPIQQVASLPRLRSPAGYVVVIQDIDYGNRFKMAQLPELNRDQLRRVVDLSIETRIALVLEADNAARVMLQLHDRFVGLGRPGDWFDLDASQVKQLDEIGRPRSPSLRELALNDIGAESLVQDAKIVRTAPESPFSHIQRREKRPARRLTAWFLLLVLVALLALVVTHQAEVRSGILRLLDDAPRQSAANDVPPTATDVPGQGEIFYVRYPARVRSCASTSCESIQTLEVGFRLVSRRFQRGQLFKGDRIWIVFEHKGRPGFVHRSLLSSKSPVLPTAERPTPMPATAVPGQGAVYYVSARASARTCASTTCRTVEMLEPGARIVALRYQTGQALAGESTWITFVRDGTLLYVHRNRLATAPPTAAKLAQASPTPLASPTSAIALETTAEPTLALANATVAAAAVVKESPTDAPPTSPVPAAAETLVAPLYVETVNNLNARVRACPGTSCDTLELLSPGTEILPLREVEGEAVAGNALWIEFDFDGEAGYIHSSLLSAEP